ncbi:MAG: DUF11 domain-containing protein [Calothrix sp. C42_A2020_038]|nr:DUF11 domain-containing protein [Calothrix sp. C42_A2020_038]
MKLIKTIATLPLLLTTFSYQILLHIPVQAQTVQPSLCAVPGKDGVSMLAGVINTYYAGAPNTTVSAGATSIPVATINPNGSTTPITAGDLLLIIQMQGADIDASNTDSYGDGIVGGGNDADLSLAPNPNGANGNLNNSNFTAGNYEYVVATGSVSGGSIGIRGAGSGGGLLNSYSNAAFGTQGQRTYQVIRVPQYSNATINPSLTAARWNGSSGGVLVYDVAGNTNLSNATVDVSGLGFRGGGAREYGGNATGLSNTDYRTLSTATANGSKGEGTAGTPRFVFNRVTNTLVDNGLANEGYPGGSFGRGAPGNAGGGSTDGNPASNNGNDENSGGGGGANGGTGGMGGRSFRSQLAVGGFGGAAFPASNGRVVMGGGGGAGTTNNGTSDPPGSLLQGLASSGAPGGGLVLIRTGSVSGNGTINANGANALNVLNDGGGGGGAGGSVVIIAANNNLAGLTVNANGGKGGDARFNLLHGPGGGGGGGVVLTSPGSINSTAGGSSGATSNPIDPTINFGAMPGNGGVQSNAGTIPGANSGAECVPQLTVNKTTSTPRITVKPGKAIYTITVTNAANRASATNVNISDPLPAGFTFDGSTPPTIILNGGAVRNSVNNPVAGATSLDFGTFDIPGGGSVEITFSADVDVNVPDNTYNNDATASYIDPTLDRPGSTPTNANIARSRYDGNVNTTEDVIVGQIPPPPPLPPTPPTPIISMRAVKRITNVLRDGVSITNVNPGVNFNVVIDDPSDTNDDASIWANSPLAPIGIARIDPELKLGAGDEVEYTIYFLVDGNQPIDQARFCDSIPPGTNFINSSGSDITLNVGNAISNQTNIADSDRASYVDAVAPLPANNVCPNQSNPTGAVLVNFGTLDPTPGANFGYVRFRVRVE